MQLRLNSRIFLSGLVILAACSSAQTDSSNASNTNTPATNERGTAPTTGCVQGNCDNGDGSFVYPGGDKYAGAFKVGAREGKGALDYATGDRYVGDFAGDKRSGNGTYTFANGDVYTGQFKDGERAGNGVYTFKEGPVFEGSFQNDGRAGTGNLKTGEKVRNCELQDRKILCAAETPEPAKTEPAKTEPATKETK